MPRKANSEFCSQNKLYYNICSTNSLTSLQLIDELSSVFDNQQCHNPASPFICNGIHLLCRNGNNLVVDLQEKCVEIHDHDCAPEWRTLKSMFDSLLEDCVNSTVDINVTFPETSPFICPDKFDVNCGIYYVLSLFGGGFALIVYSLQKKKR